MWRPEGENTYFNNSAGRLDSSYSYAGYDTSLGIYTYYPDGRIYQSAYYWLNNYRRLSFISTQYYDSANYVSRDSSVALAYAKGTDSLFTTEVVSNTHYFITNGPEKEKYPITT